MHTGMPICKQNPLVNDQRRLLGSSSSTSIDDDDESGEIQRVAKTTATIDSLSALASIVALLVLLMDSKALVFMFTTWTQFLPSTRNQEVIATMSGFKHTMQESCDIKLLDITQFAVVNPTDSRDIYNGMPLSYKPAGIYPSLLLLWVLAYSAAFQAYRASCAYIYPTQSQYAAYTKVALVCLHLYIWLRVLHVDMIHITQTNKFLFLALLSSSTALGWWQSTRYYRPNGPDFARWVEYALTSPLQLVIVAGSVWIGDRTTLYSLAVAQANMIMNGYIIELFIQRMYKFNSKHPHNNDERERTRVEKNGRCRRNALFVLLFAWVSFVGIWYCIIANYRRLDASTGQCDKCGTTSAAECTMSFCELKGGICRGLNEIPAAVPYIVGTQGVLFALFGVVQSSQLWAARNVKDHQEMRMAWHTVTLWYSILSVVAKCSLEIGFLVMLRQMPKTVGIA